MNNIEALNLKKDIQKLERKLRNLEKDISKKRQNLRDICIHNDLITEEDYIEGSYLDRDEYITITKCNICNKIINRKVKYGGFR